MIRIQDLTFGFADSESAVLRRINLEYASGEFALICGPTGSGKSTLLKALTGLVPFYSSGQLSGEVWLDQEQIAGRQPHAVSHLIGYVNQQPEGALVSETVIEELAFNLEQLGWSLPAMRERIAELSKTFGLDHLLHKRLENLSGGQQQRVAIASALAARQQVLLLDEPTSALDSQAAEDLLGLLRTLATEHGITVLLAEHRIERVLSAVDSVTVVHGDGSATKAITSQGLDPILRDYRMVPPVIELGQRMGWSPLPLDVNDAARKWQRSPAKVEVFGSGLVADLPSMEVQRTPAMTIKNLGVTYGNQIALQDISLNLWAGQISAVMGPNGSGKTSLLWAVQGTLKHTGEVQLEDGIAPSQLKPTARLERIAMVPQTAADLLMMSSISAELEASDLFAGVSRGTTATMFANLAGRIDPSRHPHDLSAGQQLALVLSIQLAKGAGVLLLDEPTRGLDYQAKRHLATKLQDLAKAGKAVLLASHDVEFVALVADSLTLIERGENVASGEPGQVLPRLGIHAPQVLQVTQSAWRLDQVVTP